MSFGVAYGEALQGLKKARLQTNLLPYEVRLERIVRGKKPWAVAAAAVLAFGMFLMALATGAEKSAFENDTVNRAKKDAEDEKKKALQLAADAAAKQAELDAAKKNLDRLGAGVQERMNWQLLHQFVNMVTPQANGGHLADESENHVRVKKVYWTDKKEAQLAFKYFEDKKYNANLKLTPEEAQKRDLFIKEHLIQLNILGINAMYSDDLAPYFKAIEKENPELSGLTDEEKGKIAKLLKGSEKDTPKSGWVVEIRGYTYHKETEKFIADTLIQNLRNPGALKDISIDEDLKKKVSERVSFLLNYKVVPVDKPQPGRFNVIETTSLPWLLAGGAVPPAANVPAVPPAPWAPIGDAASSVFSEVTDRPTEGKETLKRTEFVVLFLWEEPIVTQFAAPAPPPVPVPAPVPVPTPAPPPDKK
jgi:type IV pilus assembly protein PilM